MSQDQQMIDAFQHAVREVFETMLQVSVTFDQQCGAANDRATGEIAGIISFTGGVTGHMTLHFPVPSAIYLIGRFMGAPIDPLDPDFGDAVGELANMIAGSAKTRFGIENVTISYPSVVIGNDYLVISGKNDTNKVLSGRFDEGQLYLTLSLKPNAKKAA